MRHLLSTGTSPKRVFALAMDSSLLGRRLAWVQAVPALGRACGWCTSDPVVLRQSIPRMSKYNPPRRRRSVYPMPPMHTLSTDCRVRMSSSAAAEATSSSTMAYVPSDTIFALSSGAGAAAGVAVVRLSGSSAFDVTKSMLTSPSLLPKPRVAALRRLRDPITAEILDQALVLCFPGPKSFTGEDVVELHLHGSRAVIAGVTKALAASGIARPAERGEFTRRAFENGRMDLTEVEGLADLIAADTAEQRRQALRQLGGDVRAVFEGWREELKGCLAHAEAVIDFGEDVDDGAFEDVIPRVTALRKEMERRMNDDRRGEIVRGGVRVAIVGPANAGKSTLLNILARRPAAIVSPIAGTTRDVVEVSLDMDGVPVIVSDTAGLRERTDDPVEIEGIRRARQAASSADITIFVQDASLESFSWGSFDVTAARDALNKLQAAANDENDGSVIDSDGSGPLSLPSSSVLLVANKFDLVSGQDANLPKVPEDGKSPLFQTSLKEGRGVDALVSGLAAAVKARVSGDASGDDDDMRSAEEAPVITRARHRYHVEQAVRAMEAFELGRTGPNRDFYLPMDLATEELRIASRELGAVTGAIHVEEVLDVIFSTFCIGK